MLFQNKKIYQKRAQATLEFAFAFIVLVLIFYSVVRALQWLGPVLGSPVKLHYEGLYQGATSNSPQFNYVAQLKKADEKCKAQLPRLKLVYPGQLFSQ